MTSAAATDPRLAALALSLVRGVGSVRWRESVAAAGGDPARALARVPAAARDAAAQDARDALARADALGAAVLLLGDARYPAALLDLPDPPPALFALGDAALLARTGLDELLAAWWRELLALRHAAVKREEQVPLP